MDLENFPTNETAKDMMSMVSPVYDRSYVAKWLFEVMGQPMGLAKSTAMDLKNQAAPETATWSIPYWEQRYGITPDDSLKLKDRRSAVIRKRKFRKPMNPARIEMLVEELCGRKCEFVENTAPHFFEIKLLPGDTGVVLEKVIELVNEAKQSQKSFRVVFETPVSLRIRAEPRFLIFPYRMTGEKQKTGQYPDRNMVGVISRAELQVAADGDSQVFPHVLAGTTPDVANIGVFPSVQLQASVLEDGVTFPYPITGTEPDISVLGEIEDGGIKAAVEGTPGSAVYKICGSRKL